MTEKAVEQARRYVIEAVEDDGDAAHDVIPGPSVPSNRIFGNPELLDMSLTEHNIKGSGILASIRDVNMNADEFAAGCVLLQAAARGDLPTISKLLERNSHHVNFRDCEWKQTCSHLPFQ